MQLDGIHHVTCITGDAPGNVHFYTAVMGLRLVAKSVNQDDPTVYHLFYADEHGDPGSDITFFEYPGAARGRAGAGDGASGGVAGRVARGASTSGSSGWPTCGWSRRRDGDVLIFADPEGLEHELLVSTADAPLIAEHPEIPPELALHGFEGVRAYNRDPERSRRAAGGRDERRARGRRRAGSSAATRRGGWIRYEDPPAETPAPGAGTVHHVAWEPASRSTRSGSSACARTGVQSTPVIDRHYFHSIYFREPSGVLFEIADDGPGFTVDDPIEELGSRIILPPQFEQHRAAIESMLTPLPDPRSARTRS